MIKPSDKEIAAEIKKLQKLKKTVNKLTFFKDNQHDALDAQITVLTEKLTEEKAWDRFNYDEATHHEDDSQVPENVNYAARQAAQWLAGEEVEGGSPSAQWK